MQIPVKYILNLLITGSLFLVLLAGFIVLLIKLFDKQKRNFVLEKENIEKAHQTELLQSQLEIQEQTFENISQEIHDNIGQALIFVKLTMNTININDPGEAAGKIIQTKELVAKAIADLRSLSKTLNSTFVGNTGLISSIKYQIDILRKTGLYTVNLTVSDTLFDLSAKTEIILFRVIQELLNNIVKHAEATIIDITCNYTATQLLITIKDNGKGFDTSQSATPKTGIGLINMKNRISIINGSMNIESEPGLGTTVFITVANDYSYT